LDIQDLPILGICGFSGSGKTTLIEEILTRLQPRNLKIAVVKHSSKNADIDRPQKDSHRFFSAHADVYLHTPDELFERIHPATDLFSLDLFLRNITRQYDLVFVEGYKDAAISKVILLDDEKKGPSNLNGRVLDLFEFGPGRADRLSRILDDWLPLQWNKVPLYGCVLIGGKSSRMGSPKHLIEKNGVSWVERTVLKLSHFCKEVVVAGNNEIPESLGVAKIPDIPGMNGPVSGVGAALRWNPWASWLMTACDLPDIGVDAIDWLLRQREPGIWTIFPSVADGKVEPLFALYDFRIQGAIEKMIYSREKKIGLLKNHCKVKIVRVPENLCSSWRNVNSPGDIDPS
jgi:molybdopterin-guanine dinucleotide biosynthesis protein MobB